MPARLPALTIDTQCSTPLLLRVIMVQSVENNKTTIVVFAQTPPPEHGQSRMVAEMLDAMNACSERFDVTHVNARFSLTMDEIGDSSPRKLVLSARYLQQALFQRLGKRKPILYYIPGPVKWSSVLRDWALLTFLRPAYGRVLFHWHAIGQGEWAHGCKRLQLPGPTWLDVLARIISAFYLRKPFASFPVSPTSQKDALAVGSRQIHVVCNGIEDPCPNYDDNLFFARKRRQDELATTGSAVFRLLFLSHGSEEKGLIDVLRAVGFLLDSTNGSKRSFELTLAGGVSIVIRKEVDSLVRSLLTEGGGRLAIREQGFVTGDEKRDCFNQHDIFLAPSRWESFGLVVAEAMAYGMVVVAAASDGVTGVLPADYPFLSPVGQPEAFAEGIDQACHMYETGRALDLAESLRKRFVENFTLLRFSDSITDRLEEVARAGRGMAGSIRPRSKPMAGRKRNPDCECGINHPTVDRPQVKEGYRVLQVFNQYAEPGGEEVWVDQVTSLSDERLRIHELRFLSRAWKMRGAPSPLSQAMRMWDNPESRRRLSREVDNLRPDVLLFHNLIPVASFGLYDEARKLGVPVLQYIHNFRPFSPSGTLWHGGGVRDEALHGNPWPEVFGRAWEQSLKKTALLAFYLRRLQASGWLDTVDRWIAISEFMRGKFVEAGIPESKITILRHCWTPAVAEPTGEDQGYYLFLGRLVAEKGVGTLLDAWNQLHRRLGRKCPRLVIAGTGPEEHKVMAAARTDNVEFAGFVSGEAKQRLLSGCRAVLAPSIWWEPLGLIVYEAYDHGKPVIAARSGGLVETVREGEGGFLHTPGDSDSLVDAVLKLEEIGHAGRIEMGMTGRRWLLQKASPEAWKRDFELIVKSVIHE